MRSLPNFLNYDPLNALRQIAQAELNTNFQPKVHMNPLVLKLLEGGEIEGLKFDEIDISTDGTLEIGGQKIVVYIRDQHTNFDSIPESSNYKYHFAYCAQLKKFESQGKSDKYVATKTAKFKIAFKKFGKPIGEAEYDLNVCKYCLGAVNYRNYNNLFDLARKGVYENFSREKYFEEFDSGVENYSSYTAESAPENEYPSDWREISRRICNERGNHCEKCGSTKNLEVDHINELKYDVRPENLQVLCHYCHSKKHPHMSKFKKY